MTEKEEPKKEEPEKGKDEEKKEPEPKVSYFDLVMTAKLLGFLGSLGSLGNQKTNLNLNT